MFESFPQRQEPEKASHPQEKYHVVNEWGFDDGNGNTDWRDMGMDVESPEIQQGAQNLINKFGGFISLEEAIKYALATPEQMEALEQAIKQREVDHENGQTIENYGKLDI